MQRLALVSLCLVAFTVNTANARGEVVVCNQQGCTDWSKGRSVERAGREVVVKRAARVHRTPAAQSPLDASGNGVVRSAKTGATAQVAPVYAGKFQSYIDELEAGGATIRFMGGYRKGKCWSGGLHPCGKALDVCQLARGRVDARCHLPNRSAIAAIAQRHGLFEGGQWCSSDYGHAQVGVTAGACGSNLYSAVSKYHRSLRLSRRHGGEA